MNKKQEIVYKKICTVQEALSELIGHGEDFTEAERTMIIFMKDSLYGLAKRFFNKK